MIDAPSEELPSVRLAPVTAIAAAGAATGERRGLDREVAGQRLAEDRDGRSGAGDPHVRPAGTLIATGCPPAVTVRETAALPVLIATE